MSRAKNQYLYSVITKVIIVVIGFINSMLLARYLGPELKGITATILNYSNIFSIIITFGLHEVYPYYKRKSGNSQFVSQYMSCVLSIFILYALIATIILVVLRPSVEVTMVFIATLFHGYSTVVNYIALVEDPNSRNFTITVLTALDLLILVLFYIFLPANIVIACFVSIFAVVAESLYFTYKIQFSYSIKSIKIEFLKEIIKFGFFPMLALLLTTLNYRVDILMLEHYINVSYSDIGIYSIGVSLAEKVFLIPNAVKEILLAKLANGKSESEVVKVIRVCWPICLLATIAIIVFGQMFINLFYGNEYSGAYAITVICMFGTVFMVFFKMISTYNIVHGKQKLNVALLSVSVLSNIIMNALLIPRLGTNGAAIASDISYLLCAVLFSAYFCREFSISPIDMVKISSDDMKLLSNIVKGKLKKSRD